MTQDLDPDDWQRIKDLLREALDLNVAERRLLLDGAGLGSHLMAEVESLLAVEGRAADFMSIPVSGMSHDFFADDVTSLIGQTIGKYRLTRELGRGGMGAVYLAERDTGDFQQQVAIKVLRRELNTASVRANFEREKAILARLAHPNIARLFDAGTTDTGIPFLTMEYVEGVPIDRYCREHGTRLNERLKLFNKVARAVAFAHRNLVIHGDLKPSNILITPEGEPKLLDFGISRILDADADDLPEPMIERAHTPAYASPEQARGEPLTTATDVYSLGVVLYKMLTGTHPFAKGPKSNGDLPGQLKGDIDSILVKALSHEPDRRYVTVDEFSADIWRSIDGRPVNARRATLWYQLSRLYRRNKVAVLAGLLVVISLVTGAAAAVWQARAARAQAARAVIESNNAKSEQEKAEKISQFMAKVISYGNPAWYGEGSRFGQKGAYVIEALNDLESKIDTEFHGQPDIQAELHHKFAEVFAMQARGVPADQRAAYRAKFGAHALRALELRRQFYGERHELVAKDIFYAYRVIADEQPQQMGSLLNDGIHMMRETNPNNLNFPYMLHAYAAALMLPGYQKYHEPYRRAVTPASDESNYRIAERYLTEALPVFRLHYKEDNLAIYLAECDLAYALLMQDKRDAFDEHYAVCKSADAGMQGALSTHIEPIEAALAAARSE